MLTLDIKDTCITMMVVKGNRVQKAAKLPLEPGLIEDGVVIDKAAVSQQIKELMASYRVTEKQVIASISGLHSLYRVSSIPRLPGKMVEEAAKREMDRVMPVPLNELYTSWQAVPVSDVETMICMVGLPRNTIDAMVETLQQAGLQFSVMDIKPLAISRVADEKDAMIINVQPVSFDIIVMLNGIPELLRSLSFPSTDISASDKVAMIEEELERTVGFYNTGHKGSPITRDIATFISGDLREMLVDSLGYQVKHLPDLLSYPQDFDIDEYVVNVGLALRQVKASGSQLRLNINFVPEAYLPKPRPIIEVVSWVFVVAAVAALIPLAITTQQEVQETLSLQALVSSAQLQVQAKQGSQAKLEELQAELDAVKAMNDVYFQQPMDYREAQRAKVNGDLGKVTSLLPGTVDLKSITHKENVARGKAAESSKMITHEQGEILIAEKDVEEEIVIYVEVVVCGISPDEATILNYARDLRNTDRFSQVIISSMNEDVEYNEWEFTLTLH